MKDLHIVMTHIIIRLKKHAAFSISSKTELEIE